MRQRAPRRAWYARGGAWHRPRVLVEDADPALAISDFSQFQDAGFDVALCSGPGSAGRVCPLLQRRECVMLASADVVLHGLDPGLGVAAAIRRQHPEIAVVAVQRPRLDGSKTEPPAGCVPLAFPCSVKGQIEAVRAAWLR